MLPDVDGYDNHVDVLVFGEVFWSSVGFDVWAEIVVGDCGLGRFDRGVADCGEFVFCGGKNVGEVCFGSPETGDLVAGAGVAIETHQADSDG